MRYDTSLTDAQWAQIEPLLPVRNPPDGGRARCHDPAHSRRLASEEIYREGPIETEAARRLAENINNE